VVILSKFKSSYSIIVSTTDILAPADEGRNTSILPAVKIIFEAVAGQGGVAGRAHVEVVRRSAGRGGDGFSAHDAEVAFVLVAEGRSLAVTAGGSPRAAMTTSMSMMGLAANPGTAVLLTCSMRWARGPSAATAGPGPPPRPLATSASGIKNKTHDGWARYRIADTDSGFCPRHDDIDCVRP